jgi:serine phosphatase RsbU (regulator of sigma subunit)
MQTATEVGGDYYDFHVGIDGTLTVVIGDATGHGMKAGTMVTTAKSLFNSYAPNPDILFSFREITRCIKHMNLDKLSMCMSMLKIRENTLLMSSAGMPPVLLFRRQDRTVEEHLIQGMPLGAMEKFPYEIKETTLSPGDTIMLMSDGLAETRNSDDELFGYMRVRNSFEEVADKEPEEIISHLKEQGIKWSAGNKADDDITFVVLKIEK